MQNCNIFFFITGRLSIYGYCFLEHLRKPEIIHAEFPLKISSAMNSITLVQFTPLTKLNKTEEAIIKSGLLLLIGETAAKRSLDQDKNLKIDVTIQNLKNDAISKESQVFYQTDSDSVSSLESDSE